MFNLLGRLSVAMYGLAFNLDDSILDVRALYATNISAVSDTSVSALGEGTSGQYMLLLRWSIERLIHNVNCLSSLLRRRLT